jgi:cellulose biosynthesis protein BcsQ
VSGVQKRPYILVFGSHKGGTGRTTSALALAYLWGAAGLTVSFIDADPVGAARMVALDLDGNCPWEGVRFFPHLPDSGRGLAGSDLVIIDAPPLTERSAQRVLRLADGVIVTCLADPLSLRTIPRAARALQQARAHNTRLTFLGLHIAVFHERDALQANLLRQLRLTHGGLLLEPPIPGQREISDWPLAPGSPLPDGPAREAYAALAATLESTFARGSLVGQPPPLDGVGQSHTCDVAV